MEVLMGTGVMSDRTPMWSVRRDSSSCLKEGVSGRVGETHDI